MAKCNGRNHFIAIAIMALVMITSNTWLKLTSAQGIKGGSFISNSQQVQQVPQTAGNQFSSSFVQMFNSLTPTEQQQFIKQMSSSNRRVFQQVFQPQTSGFFNEEVSSSSGGSNPFVSGGAISSSGSRFGGTKSGSSFSKQITSQNQVIPSPVQQFFKQQSSSQSFVQPTIKPSTSSFSEFSRQISSTVPQQITLPQTNEQSFQSTKSFVAQPQPQQQSFFNQIQRVQQVAQPVVLPSSEQNFRRVQSFQSVPLPVQQEASSGFTSQQFVQQIQPQPVARTSSSSFNRRIQVVPQPVVNNQFSSVSSSSNLAGGLPSSFDQSSGGFSANFQQEKLDIPITTGGNFEQNQFVQTQNGFTPVTTGTINQSSLQESGFDSSDVQQRNLAGNFIGDDGGGITAASINNKWYIMKPIEDPKALGLEDARAASGSLRRISLGRSQSAKLRAGETGTLRSATSSAADRASSSTSSTSSSSGAVPKKRSASTVEKDKEKEKSTSESSSLIESDDGSEADEVEERRKS